MIVDGEGKFLPGLAAEAPTVGNGGISADGLIRRVKLRHRMTWHDGTPFTAEDVKFTLELLVSPDFRGWHRAGHELVENLTVVSPTELTWTMSAPHAPYVSILASTFIVPRHAFDDQADLNATPFNNAPICTGPFKWENRVAGDHIEMAANTEHFGDGPYVEKLIYKYLPDLTVHHTQFKTCEIDVIGPRGITAETACGEARLASRLRGSDDRREPAARTGAEIHAADLRRDRRRDDDQQSAARGDVGRPPDAVAIRDGDRGRRNSP